MYKIAVLGEQESVLGFSALGLSVFCVTGPEEAEKTLKKLARSGEYAVIYVTESFAGSLAGEIEKYKEQAVPAIILIPGVSGNTGEGIAGVKKSVEQAVGSDILFSNH